MASSAQHSTPLPPCLTRTDIFYAEMNRLGISLTIHGGGSLVGDRTHAEHIHALARYHSGSLLSRYSDEDLIFIPYDDARYMLATDFRSCYVAGNVDGEKTLLEMQGPSTQGYSGSCGKGTSEQTLVVSEKGKKVVFVKNEAGGVIHTVEGRSAEAPFAPSAAEMQDPAGPLTRVITLPPASSSIFPRTAQRAYNPEARAFIPSSPAPGTMMRPQALASAPEPPTPKITVQPQSTVAFRPPPYEHLAHSPLISTAYPTYDDHEYVSGPLPSGNGNASSSPPPLVWDSGSQSSTPFSSPPTSPWLTPKSTLPSWHRETEWHNLWPSAQSCQGCRRPAAAHAITLALRAMYTDRRAGLLDKWLSGVVVQSTSRYITWSEPGRAEQRRICKSCLRWEEKLKIRATWRRSAVRTAHTGTDSSSDSSESDDESPDEDFDESGTIDVSASKRMA